MMVANTTTGIMKQHTRDTAGVIMRNMVVNVGKWKEKRFEGELNKGWRRFVLLPEHAR